VNPKLSVPSAISRHAAIGTTMVSFRWENVRPKQALIALLDACDLVLVEDPKTSSGVVRTKSSEQAQSGLLSRNNH
jgi:hypothetical protein